MSPLQCWSEHKYKIISDITLKRDIDNEIILMNNTPPAYVEAYVKEYACYVTYRPV